VTASKKSAESKIAIMRILPLRYTARAADGCIE
jgi:hypothetical protein